MYEQSSPARNKIVPAGHSVSCAIEATAVRMGLAEVLQKLNTFHFFRQDHVPSPPWCGAIGAD